MAWQYAATMEERTGADIKRPPTSVIEGLANVSAATAGAELCNTFGIRNSHISGGITAQASNGGKKIVGPAITLQFMPLREDIYPDNINRGPGKLPENPDGANTIQLHRAALYHTKPGDVIVVDARGDMDSGIFGEMMATYFQGAGGLGMVIDGCLRDFPVISRELDLVSTATICPRHVIRPCCLQGLWIKGATPNFHTQTNIVPWAVNVPISCGGRLVMPGDIIVADDDGAVINDAPTTPCLSAPPPPPPHKAMLTVWVGAGLRAAGLGGGARARRSAPRRVGSVLQGEPHERRRPAPLLPDGGGRHAVAAGGVGGVRGVEEGAAVRPKGKATECFATHLAREQQQRHEPKACP